MLVDTFVPLLIGRYPSEAVACFICIVTQERDTPMDELLERAINQLNNAAAAYQAWGDQEKARELHELAEQIWTNFGGKTSFDKTNKTTVRAAEIAQFDVEQEAIPAAACY
ncbi:MAG TPA: hypothetical protein V6C81_03605 [Planktothrix sp.]|jgi:hypothetical protein